MKNTERTVIVAALCCGLLSACGGGSGDAAPGVPPPAVPGPLDAVPPEASQSSAGLVAYLSALAALLVDDREPADLGSFNPVKPEDTEPEPVG